MLVFTGKQIVVHNHEGTSEYLLVTFNQLDIHAKNSQRFFLQEQVRQADISCIGVVTTEDGFYLSPEMEEVFRIVREARRGRKIIVFGQSMGGFAALKYSNALQADYVVALSPYYSLDPEELELTDERQHRLLVHSMKQLGVAQRPIFKGMGLKPHDVRGRLFIMFDPSQEIDTFAAQLIEKHLPGVMPIRLWHAGHVIYDAAWEASIISGLLDAVLSEEPRAVESEMIRLRRSHPRFILRTLHKAAYRKPLLCSSAIRSSRVAEHWDAPQMIAHPVNLRLVYLLNACGHKTAARGHFNFVNRTLLGPGHDALDTGDATPKEVLEDNARCLLLSCHGSILAYDTIRRHARFETHVFGRDQLYPLMMCIDGGSVRFCILSGDIEVPILLTPHDVVASVTDPAIEVIPDNVHRLILRKGSSVFGAGADGALHLSSAVTGSEQRFVAVAIPIKSPALKAESLSWFDRIALSVPDASLGDQIHLKDAPRRRFSLRKLVAQASRRG